MRLCTPFSPADVSAAAGGGSSGPYHSHRSAAPGSARAEAERRRALALRALDQRLQNSIGGRPVAGSVVGLSVSPTPPPPVAMATPPPPTTGPTVQTQPANSQTAMTSLPGDGMLGETSYNPEHDGSDKGEA